MSAFVVLAVWLAACDDGEDQLGALDLGSRIDGGLDGAVPIDVGRPDAAPDSARPDAARDAAPDVPDLAVDAAVPIDVGPPDDGPPPCQGAEDCGPGMACADGACVPRCEPGGCGDGHCGSAWVCEEGPCLSDAACAPGSYCALDDGACRPGCRQAPDSCPEGERCAADHTCVPGCEGQPEVCNGRDDDCDGAADEGLDVGAPCTNGTGACARDGVRACNDAFEVVCEGPLGEGSDEICNGIDDDCDGEIDDGLGLGEACAVGEGACRAEGVQVCRDEAVVCDAVPGAAGIDRCNGLDDDCDGAIDEGFGVGEPCQEGQGACASQGQWACNGEGGARCDAPAPNGVPELCNAVDDDCDGQIDEDLGGAACPTGLPGACDRGVRACEAGALLCRPAVEPAAETCDGTDEDCDGQIDEDTGTVPCGEGVCRRALPACVDGGAPACDPFAGAQAQELCNGLDDDCDGRVDEDALGDGEACGAGRGACQRAGVRVCVDGAQVCDAEPGAPQPETCNGVDDDCDGMVDDGAIAEGEVCQVGVGACVAAGQPVCVGGRVVCEGEPGAPGDEVCNGIDDNCDGDVDEGFGAPCGVGQCRRILAACDGGAPAACDPLVGAEPERCDGVDNDCDGQTDEGVPGLGVACVAGAGGCELPGLTACVDGAEACVPDEAERPAEVCNGLDDDCDGQTDEQPVDEGAACSAGRGVCTQPGALRCMAGNLLCDAVAGLPSPEVCNGVDDDCDGVIDQGLGTTPCGQGVCARALPACVDGAAPACDPLLGAGDEVCNGLDDDCDGVIDEGTGGAACALGQGACRADGAERCVEGALRCDAVPGAPVAERCNTLDDDCDGQVDEGLGLGAACAQGVGACQADGVVRCGDDGGTVCDAVPGAPAAELCNGLDDDCDGQSDEGTAGAACATGQPGVCGAGTTTCAAGQAGCAPDVAPSAERCDGLDNDCNGQVDDALDAVICGLGVCARPVAACVDGAPAGCDPLLGAGDEVCNGLDDDCDGQTDEGLGGAACTAGVGACEVAGLSRCEAGVVVCDAQPGPAGVELCNGVDDDCDGEIDNAPTDLGPCAAGVGACQRAAESVCVDGAVLCPAEPGAPVPEACNGLDDDCDDALDEGFGSTVCGVGACRHAVPNCDGGAAPECDPLEGAGPELCNGIDDDCDGQIDEAAAGTGENCAVGEGACRVVAVTACVGGVLQCPARPLAPRLEVCDRQDNDCDGQVDEEAQGTGEACDYGVGACAARGEVVCFDGSIVCNAVPGDPVAEQCNGVDDDCDGQIDDGLEITCGVGACQRTVNGCVDGAEVACVPFEPRPEICDGADNDCDGQIDEGQGETVCGLGACETRIPRCVDGVLNACPPQQGAQPEICDGIDNDCDGHIDDGVAPRVCTRGLGVCQRQDFEQCHQGQWNCLAAAADVAGPETCNTLDDDCDGQVDEDVPEAGQVCERGVGACRDVQITRCEDGFVVCPAVAGDAADEICNDVDDDCDGAVDEVGPDCDGNGQGDDCDVADGAPDCNDNGIPDSCDIGELRSGDCDENGVPDECEGDGLGCIPDVTAPEIDLFLQGTVVNRGTTIQVIVRYTEEGSGVDTVGLTLDGQPVQLDQFNQAFVELTQPGFQTFVGWATDRAGNRGEQTRQVRVLEPNDVARPVIQVHTPNNGQQMFADVVFNVTITDESLTDWWLTWGPRNNPAAQEIARGVDEVLAGDIATIDIDGLQAGEYGFQLTAVDVNGAGSRVSGFFVVPDCTPEAEICNHTDDDCDGVADNGVVGLGAPCAHGVGECRREGTGVCAADGSVICDEPEGLPQIELCDGLDNDCDGSVDERWPVGQACHLGVGVCRRAGEVRCTPDTTAALCDAEPGEPGVEACNGLDDDCDGAVDERVRGCGVDTPPTVTIWRPNDDAPAPGDIEFEVRAEDDFDVVSRTLTLDGDAVALDAQGRATVNLRAGRYALVATATDDQGQSAQDVFTLWVNEPLDSFNPFVEIDHPRPDQVIALPFQVRGTAADETLVEWILTLEPPADGGAPVELARGTQEIGNDVLAEIDPQAMPNGAWNLVLWAVDANHRSSTYLVRVRIEGCEPQAEVCDGADQDCDNRADEGLAGCPGDVTPPQVQLTSNGSNANVGDPYDVAVFATDDVWVDRRALAIDGVEQPIEEGVVVRVPLAQPGRLVIEGRAWDTAGNLGVDRQTVRVLDPDDVEAPVIDITRPEVGAAVDGPVVIEGRIDDETLWDWTVYRGTEADPEAHVLAEGQASVDGVLAEFDAGALPDGPIVIRVVAEDVNGRRRVLDWPLRVRPCEPAPDVCDGVDNDCDGTADEDFAELGQPCEAGFGQCRTQGQLACAANGQFVVCDAVPAEPQPERCDQLDHDCNGHATNGFELGRFCEVGVGACARAGRTVCSGAGDAVVCDAQPGAPVAEACDHADNDCDGAIDEGFAQIECGVGACFRVIGACAGQAACNPLEGAQAETCNGVDDDCDGTVDEAALDAGQACFAGEGACRREGVVRCVDGATACDAVAAAPGVELCDEIVDNDCDGAIDEGFVCPDETDPVLQVQVAPNPVDLGQAITVTVVATDDRGAPAVAVTVDGAPLPLDENGQAVYVPQAFGAYTVRVVATDDAGNQTVETVSGAVRDPNDVAAPVVALTGPEAYSEVGAPVTITGSVADDTLVAWTLDYESVGTPGTWVTIAEGDSPVDGALGQFDPTMLENGVYRLMLTGRDANGRIARAFLRLRVVGEAKVGIFTITYTDVTVPVAGVPLTVERTYDSRMKGVGDFGVGWRLSMRQGSIEHTHPIHDGWGVHPGGFLGLPCQQAGEAVPHLTEIELSKRERYVFRPELVPAGITLGGCFVRLRYVFVHSSRPGRATLEPTGVDQLVWQANSEVLADIDGSEAEVNRARLHTADGRTFDVSMQAGGVVFIEDANDNTVRIESGGLHHSTGRSVVFERDAARRITAVVLPSGERLTYTYDARGDLVASTDEAGHTTTYRYDANHHLTDIVDPTGNTPARNEYDASGRLVAVVYADGTRVAMDHDVDARVEIARDRLGNAEVFEYDQRGNVLSKVDKRGFVTQFTYDAADRVLSETDDAGNTTRYTYDAVGHRLTATDPLGGQMQRVYANDRLVSETDPAGGVTQITYDARGNVLSETDPDGFEVAYTYNARGQRLTKTEPGGAVWTWTYDEVGRALSETDPLGHEITYTYDARGFRTSETRRWTGPDGLGDHVARFEYDVSGNLTRVIDAAGGERLMRYNALGKVMDETDALGRTKTYAYDSLGNLIRTTYADGSTESQDWDANGNRTRVVDRDGMETTYAYDAAGNVIRVVFADGTQVEREYDHRGLLVLERDARGQEMRREYDAAGRNVRVVDALGRATGYEYDAVGRQTAVIYPDGAREEIDYDGRGNVLEQRYPDGGVERWTYDGRSNKTSFTDLEGHVTTYDYDLKNRLIRVTDALGGETRYAYDELGNRIEVIDANGATTRHAYDAMGRRLNTTLPDGTQQTFAFDAVGQMIASEDFDGTLTTFDYDVAGHLIRRDTEGEGVETAQRSAGGRRLRYEDARGVETWRYDAKGRMIEHDNADGVVLSWQYDGGDHITQRTDPTGQTTYAYDALGRLERVIAPSGDTTEYTYNVAGSLASVRYDNGVESAYTYDQRQRLIQIQTTDAQGAVLADYHYTVGVAGNRLRVEERHRQRAVDYTYDALYRLVEERITEGDDVRTISYTYDAVGNRLSRDDSADGRIDYAYDVNDRLVSAGPVQFEYDPKGNLTRKQGPGFDHQYLYDARNRMVLAEQGASLIEYTYDMAGNRVAADVDGQLVRYLYDSALTIPRLIRLTDNGGQELARYTHGADLISQTAANETHWYVYDGQLSTRQLTDAQGAVATRYDYDAFGMELFRAGNVPNPFQYGGEYTDGNTGFVYLRARWLDPSTGRFNSHDPAEGRPFEPKTFHRYTYVENDPVGKMDPSGKFSLVSISISISIQGTLRSIYTGNLVKTFLKVNRIAQCVLRGAYADMNTGMEMMLGGLTGGSEMYTSGRQKVAAAYRAIGAAIGETWQNILDDMVKFEFKIDKEIDLKIAKINAFNCSLSGGAGSGISDESGCKWLEVKPIWEEYKEKAEATYTSAKKWYDTVTEAFAGEACAQAKLLEMVGNKLVSKMPSF